MSDRVTDGGTEKDRGREGEEKNERGWQIRETKLEREGESQREREGGINGGRAGKGAECRG